MPLFYQHNINEDEKLGVWKIEEEEDFFLSKVPLNRDISHQHKRLQHLAGRYLLQYLFPDFPYDLIQIADTRKPFLFNEAYHFSISHCDEYAAALVSRWRRVGIDIEIVTPTIGKIQHKFLTEEEINYLVTCEKKLAGEEVYNGHQFNNGLGIDEPGAKAGSEITMAASSGLVTVTTNNLELLTLCWSAKEALYKWYGKGGVDFKNHMQLLDIGLTAHEEWMESAFLFQKEKPVPLTLRSRFFEDLVLTYVIS